MEIERRNRIRLSLAAYSYEYLSVSLISDEAFDELSSKINVNITTGNKKIDSFFRQEFDKDTGMWIRKHPELNKIKDLYHRLYPTT